MQATTGRICMHHVEWQSQPLQQCLKNDLTPDLTQKDDLTPETSSLIISRQDILPPARAQRSGSTAVLPAGQLPGHHDDHGMVTVHGTALPAFSE